MKTVHLLLFVSVSPFPMIAKNGDSLVKSQHCCSLIAHRVMMGDVGTIKDLTGMVLPSRWVSTHSPSSSPRRGHQR